MHTEESLKPAAEGQALLPERGRREIGSRPTGLVLFSSFQKGNALPGYVRYALSGLSETGFRIVLLTTQDDLDEASRSFLDERGIALFATVNRGFDFGMWRRYLEGVSAAERGSWERIVLMNDSVVYYRNVFPDLFMRAEAESADAVSLSSNKAYGYHLQSFFLYLKSPAIPLFFDHLFSSPEQPDYWSTVVNMEIGLSRRMLREKLILKPLFKTKAPFDFSYDQIIRGHGGFVKRKLLESRYTFGQAMFFIRNSRRGFTADYERLILETADMDPAFDPSWLKTRVPFSFAEKCRIRALVFLFWMWTLVSSASVIALGVVIAEALRRRLGVVPGMIGIVLLPLAGLWLLYDIRRRIDASEMKPIDGRPDPDYC